MARIETATMELASYILRQKVGMDLRTYLEAKRQETISLPDGTTIKATWDDVAYWLRRDTNEEVRAVRESVRNYARRYGIADPEHDYGVDPEAMPDGSEPSAKPVEV